MRLRTVFLAAASAVTSLGLSAFGGTLKTADSFGSGNGGEFKVTSFTGGAALPSGPGVLESGSMFQTFCIETNEFLSHGTTYHWQLNTQAVNGGSGGGNPDPLDARTAYLFTKFWNGTLLDAANNSYLSANRVANANALQEAIWHLENETVTTNSQALAWVNEAGEATTLGADNQITWSGIGQVRVLNLWTNSNFTGNAQDLLVLVPTPTASLAGMSLLAGMGVLGYVKRRRNNADIV